MPTSLQGIAKKAQSQKRYRFRNLYGMLDEELLKESWREIKKHAAYGVDQISAQDYEQNLEGNIRDLVERLKQKRYRAKLVKRHSIPKGNGQLRPLGIPAVEDKLLQVAATRLLEAIYEQDFLRCSYGYRPGVGALDAVDKLTVKLQFGHYPYVVEADIKGFFDSVDHDWMLRMLGERIEDRAFLGLIRKGLQAGILDTTGAIIHPATGTPQGGVLTPPTIWQNTVVGTWGRGSWGHAKDDCDLVLVNLYTPHQGTNNLPLGEPICLREPALPLGNEVLQLPNDQLQLPLLRGLIR